MALDEICACCGTIRPMVDQAAAAMGLDDDRWVTFEGGSELIIDVPDGDVLLPFEVVDAIRTFAGGVVNGCEANGLVRLERPGPEVTGARRSVVSVREVHSHYAGVVCPECLGKHEDWDDHQWLWHLSSLDTSEPDT